MRQLEYMLESPVAFFIFVITILTSYLAENPSSPIKEKFLFNAYQVYHRKEWYRLLTSGLVHGNFSHLFVNMLTFYFSAFALERLFLGHVNFMIVYLGSQLLCCLPDLFTYRDKIHYNAVGASGAISGILFSYALFALAYAPSSMVYLFFFIPMPIWLFPPFFIVVSILLDRYGRDNIGHRAHLAGAITGSIITFLLKPELIFEVWHSILNIRIF